VKAAAQAIYLADGRPRASHGRLSRIPQELVPSLPRVWCGDCSKICASCCHSSRSTASVAQTAHHQHHQALALSKSAAAQAHGLLCERRKCRPHHLLHLPEIQPGMENPTLKLFTQSSLTSPERWRRLTLNLTYSRICPSPLVECWCQHVSLRRRECKTPRSPESVLSQKRFFPSFS